MMRLFVGLALPSPLSARLSMLAGGIPGAHWVEARNLHLTLSFIGEVDEGAAQSIDQELIRLDEAAVPLSVDGFGTFGHKTPKHLWARVTPDPALLHVQAKVETLLRQLDQPVDGRKFVPHITLAHLRQVRPERLQAFLEAYSPLSLGPWTIPEISLFRSHLGHGGAEYEVLATYPLRVVSPSCAGQKVFVPCAP